ncbi:MAG: ASCH domain-containing protein [Lachnospiraceae bacterium]|nr:ASCH domain-containing protein [Lachnospiraceae bacterium]
MREDVYLMRLAEGPFERIKSGQKKMELRLNDSKRRNLDIDDYIIFKKMPEEKEEIAVKVRSLHKYRSFKDLFEELSDEEFGIATNLSVNEAVERMREFYSEEDEKTYGVLGIGIEICDLERAHFRIDQINEAQIEHYFPDGMK